MPRSKRPSAENRRLRRNAEARLSGSTPGPASADEDIATNARRINQGQMPLYGREITDFFFFTQDDSSEAGDLTVDLVARRIPGRFGFQPEDIQVLSPMHRGMCGVGTLNGDSTAGENAGRKLSVSRSTLWLTA